MRDFLLLMRDILREKREEERLEEKLEEEELLQLFFFFIEFEIEKGAESELLFSDTIYTRLIFFYTLDYMIWLYSFLYFNSASFSSKSSSSNQLP